jgi:transmembrane sensor
MLARHARGQLNKSELAELETWLSQSPENKELLQQIQDIYEKDRQLAVTEKYRHYDTDAAFSKFLKDIAAEKRSAKKISRSLWIRTAAAACILVVVGIGLLYMNPAIRQHAALQPNSKGEEKINWKHYQAKVGHVMHITLADGSTVRLSPGSILKYPGSFGDRERRVLLEGEAYFEVTKDSLRPFIVQAPRLSTRVLGTSFNIEAYKDMVFTKITLLTGKIAVSRNEEGPGPDSILAVLEPDESIIISNEDTTFSVSRVKPGNTKAIKEGKLVFDGTNMKDIAYKIGLHYDVRVHIEDPSIETMIFTGTFDHIALEKLTAMIEKATGLIIEQRGNELFIRKS